MRRAATVLRRLAAAVVAAALLAPPALSVVDVRVFTVAGGSMTPTFRRGDVVLVAAPTGHDLVVGAVLMVGADTSPYVHRVVAVTAEHATTQGDANRIPDPTRVTEADVHGVVVGHLGGLAAVAVTAATSTLGRIGLILALALLLLAPTWLTRARTHDPRTTRPVSEEGRP